MTASARQSSEQGSEVAQALREVASLEALHSVLSRLAQNPGNRWTRSQVLHYLAPEFRSAAEAFFEGESLKALGDQPPRPSPIDVEELDAVIARIHKLAPAGDSTPEPPRARIRNTEEIIGEVDGAGDRKTAGDEEQTEVAQMLAALVEEIRAVDRKQPKRYRLKDGRCVASADGRFVYQFTWSSDPDMFVPGTLQVGTERYDARVGLQSADAERTYDLSIGTYLGPNIARGVFRVDPTFLLRALYERLKGEDAQRDDPAIYAKRLLESPGSFVAPPTEASQAPGLNTQQREAVDVATNVDLAYVWGPPGTGKTTTLGALVSSLVAVGKRVLVISPYNVAVDEAILAVIKREQVTPRSIVRFGRTSPDVRAKGVDLDSHLERIAASNGALQLARQLYAVAHGDAPGAVASPPSSVGACLDALGAILISSGASRGDQRVSRILAALNTLRAVFRAPETAVVTGAQVVGTTMALSLVSPLVHQRGYDHLLIDEASVLRSPEGLVAWLMAKCPVTFFGDPKQLPRSFRNGRR